MPTEGSLSSELSPASTRCTCHVTPLSVLTLTDGCPPQYSVLVRLSAVGWPPQPLIGRYAVPSGATRTWPCSAEHAPPSAAIVGSVSPVALAGVLYAGTALVNVVPPSRLTAQLPLK